MNAKEVLRWAPRLARGDCRAYVDLKIDGSRRLIVLPGATGRKINVRACDAQGIPSGPVERISAKELRLEPLVLEGELLNFKKFYVPVCKNTRAQGIFIFWGLMYFQALTDNR